MGSLHRGEGDDWDGAISKGMNERLARGALHGALSPATSMGPPELSFATSMGPPFRQ
jgi:hypothetical protein